MFNTCVFSWACIKTVVLVIVYHITCYCILNIITLCLLSGCLWGGGGGVTGGTEGFGVLQVFENPAPIQKVNFHSFHSFISLS